MRGGGARLPGDPTRPCLIFQACPRSCAPPDASCPSSRSLCRKAVGPTHKGGAWTFGVYPRTSLPGEANPDAAVLPGQPGGHPSPKRTTRGLCGRIGGVWTRFLSDQREKLATMLKSLRFFSGWPSPPAIFIHRQPRHAGRPSRETWYSLASASCSAARSSSWSSRTIALRWAPCVGDLKFV